MRKRQRRTYMNNTEERISELENEVKELKKKLQEALRENDYLYIT